jgi:hypothetical protein
MQAIGLPRSLEADFRIPDPDDIVVRQPTVRQNPLPVHEGTMGARQVVDFNPLIRTPQAGVFP